MAIFYLNEQVNEQTEEMSSEELLDNLAEACDSMMAMLGVDESTALQRHYGLTQKNMKENDKLGREILDDSKAGRAVNKVSDAMTKSKTLATAAAKQAGKNFHSGKTDETLDKTYSGKGITGKMMNKAGLDDLDDKEKEQTKMLSKAAAKAATGYALNKYHQASGADVKKAYDQGAAKGDKIAQKKAIKETCLYILSILDEI